MSPCAIQFVIAAFLLPGVARAQLDIINNVDVKDTLIRMERKIGAMEKRLESVEVELKEQKEINEELTLKVADLTHQMSAKTQNHICSRCSKKTPSTMKSSTTYFDKFASKRKQSTASKHPAEKTKGQSGLIRMLVQALAKQEKRITAMEKTCSQIQSQGNEHYDSSSGVNATIANGRNKRLNEGGMNRPGRALEAKIAFTAYLNHALTNIGAEHVIQMTGILLNEGNGYNHYTGIFSAPQSGVYMFSYSIVDNHAHTLRVNLVVNGSKRVGAITNQRYNGYYQHGGNLAILRLSAGNSVWLRVAESGDSIYGTSTYRYSTFSGVFLYS